MSAFSWRPDASKEITELMSSLTYRDAGVDIDAGDALRAYRAGEADYFQFTQGIEQAFQLNAEHLRVRYELALTVLHLRALNGL